MPGLTGRWFLLCCRQHPTFPLPTRCCCCCACLMWGINCWEGKSTELCAVICGHRQSATWMKHFRHWGSLVKEPLHPAASKFRPAFVLQLMRGKRSKTFFACNDGDDNMSPSFLAVKLSSGPFFTQGLTELGWKSLLQHHRKTNASTWPLV